MAPGPGVGDAAAEDDEEEREAEQRQHREAHEHQGFDPDTVQHVLHEREVDAPDEHRRQRRGERKAGLRKAFSGSH